MPEFWVTPLGGLPIGAVFAGILIALRVRPGLTCLLSPALTILALWLALRTQFTVFELGPFTVISLILAFWLAMAAAAVTGWLMLRRERA